MLLGVAYVNLADALHLSGRPDEARAVIEEGLAEIDGGVPGRAWVPTFAAELAIDRGEYDAAAAYLRTVGRVSGNTRVNVELRRAELALAAARTTRARALDRGGRGAAGGLAGAAVRRGRGRAARRAGPARRRLVCAREAVESALERLEFCSDDTVRLARLAATGVAIEADLAQRARDLGDAEARPTRSPAPGSCSARAEAAAAGGRPMEAAYAATAGAHHLGHGRRPGRGVDRARATHGTALERPLLGGAARVARGRGVPGRRAARRAPPRRPATRWRARGGSARAWLVDELEGLIARARLALERGDASAATAPTAPADADDDDDPFGLTPRERQVLALVARGATNREIGAELFMAEKTASVHVSRILAKLDVRSRTEAAAVAHRLGLAAAG